MEENDNIRLFDPAPHPDRRPDPWPSWPAAAVEPAPDLRACGRILWKRRWTVLSVLLVTLTAVLLYTVKQKPLYRAQAMLEVRQENPNIVTVERLFELQGVSPDYLETQYKILRSDTLARQVIAQLHLDRTSEFNPPSRGWPWQVNAESARGAAQISLAAAAGEQRVLRKFEDCLSVDPIRRSLLVRVSFDSRDPGRAATPPPLTVASTSKLDATSATSSDRRAETRCCSVTKYSSNFLPLTFHPPVPGRRKMRAIADLRRPVP